MQDVDDGESNQSSHQYWYHTVHWTCINIGVQFVEGRKGSTVQPLCSVDSVYDLHINRNQVCAVVLN
jgi:hypothetical protein